MTELQRIIKYLAIAFAVFLTVTIIGGILGAIGLVGGLFVGESVSGEMKTYPVSTQIRNLDIEIKAADFSIKEGQSFSVESNLKDLKVEEKNGKLTVKDTEKTSFFGINVSENAVLTVYIPAGTVLENVNLITGVGRVTIENLVSETLDFELGAGDVFVDSLTATRSADIEGGVGRITVTDGAMKDLDLQMGVGQLNLTAALTGECKLELGVGESNITLVGEKEDYKLDLEKGIGSVSVDGKHFSDNGSSGHGANKVEIHGGIGAIRVQFQQQ